MCMSKFAMRNEVLGMTYKANKMIPKWQEGMYTVGEVVKFVNNCNQRLRRIEKYVSEEWGLNTDTRRAEYWGMKYDIKYLHKVLDEIAGYFDEDEQGGF